MRLKKIQDFLSSKGWKFQYHEEDGCGSIDFEYRGISYHIWEFFESGIYGVESNVKNGGWPEDFIDNYEEDVIEVIKNWK